VLGIHFSDKSFLELHFKVSLVIRVPREKVPVLSCDCLFSEFLDLIKLSTSREGSFESATIWTLHTGKYLDWLLLAMLTFCRSVTSTRALEAFSSRS